MVYYPSITTSCSSCRDKWFFVKKRAIYERFIYRILYTELLKNTSPFMGYFSIQALHNLIRDELFLSHLVSISLIWDVDYSTFYFSLRINPSCVSTSSLLILLVFFCLQVTFVDSIPKLKRNKYFSFSSFLIRSMATQSAFSQ